MRLDLYQQYLDLFTAVRVALRHERTERVSTLLDDADRQPDVRRAAALLAARDAAAAACPPRSEQEFLREVVSGPRSNAA